MYEFEEVAARGGVRVDRDVLDKEFVLLGGLGDHDD